jgi:hypothetical protein
MVPSVDPEKPKTPEATMTTDTTEDDEVTVIEMSDEEWEAMKRRRLEKLGLTYEELEDMARRRDFSSIDALKLWYTIGPIGG